MNFCLKIILNDKDIAFVVYLQTGSKKHKKPPKLKKYKDNHDTTNDKKTKIEANSYSFYTPKPTSRRIFFALFVFKRFFLFQF